MSESSQRESSFCIVLKMRNAVQSTDGFFGVCHWSLISDSRTACSVGSSLDALAISGRVMALGVVSFIMKEMYSSATLVSCDVSRRTTGCLLRKLAGFVSPGLYVRVNNFIN